MQGAYLNPAGNAKVLIGVTKRVKEIIDNLGMGLLRRFFVQDDTLTVYKFLLRQFFVC